MNQNIENKFEIILLRPELYSEVVEMSDRYLGTGLYTEQSLKSIAEDPASRFYLIKDHENGNTAALFYYHFGTFESICDRYCYIDRALCGGDEMTGVLRSIAVKEQYRKTGLSEYLIDRFSEQLFSEFMVRRIFVLAWVKRDYVPARHCLGNCGFSELYRIKRPWYNEAGLKCHICNSERCICDGLLYKKEQR